MSIIISPVTGPNKKPLLGVKNHQERSIRGLSGRFAKAAV